MARAQALKPTNAVVHEDEAVQQTIAAYPTAAQRRLRQVTRLMAREASRLGVERINATLKWGEPSYSTTGGSPLRLAWSAKATRRLGMYCHCSTRLIETFRELFGDRFEFDGQRALYLPLTGRLPSAELSQCLRMALRYHTLKKLPLLGA